MLLRNIIIIFCISLVEPLIAQNNLSSKIVDEQHRAIAYVHVWIDGSSQGVISNRSGEFNLSVSAFPVKIHVSHLSFQARLIEIKKAEDWPKSIELQLAITHLPTATISTEKLIDLTDQYWYDISDFELYQDHLLLLTYQWKRKVNPWLVMLNAWGDTLWSQSIPYEGRLYKDCLGNIHLITESDAYQLFIQENSVALYPPVEIEAFKTELEPCVASFGEKIYIEQYTYGRQVLNYYEADLRDTSAEQVFSIADERALRWMMDDAKGLSPPRDVHEQRFEELFFYDPIYAPLVRWKDTVVVFDFVNDNIEIYNEQYLLLHRVNIDFHHTLKWKEILLVDQENSDVYAMFRRGGFHFLHRINLNDGALGNPIDIPHFTFVGKMRVHKGSLYFLYRDRLQDQALTKIYKMNL
ncbi:MAG: carboxypeptidase-like regulatory domain-containing protein [Bacteroidales bacterium]|nr:carboxypeptidase-like regulatory domain-containing protein [Bacteroidales bacterium]